jgi:ABC-type transport system substrate-binding protein
MLFHKACAMRVVLKLFPVIWAFGLFLGCQNNAGSNRAHAPQTVVIGLTSDFDTLLELGTANSDALHVIEEMLFLTLCELDETLNLQPRLAESWQISPDGKAVTFKLRGDVVWSDGQPVTAADVLFTYELAVNPKVCRERLSQIFFQSSLACSLQIDRCQAFHSGL